MMCVMKLSYSNFIGLKKTNENLTPTQRTDHRLNLEINGCKVVIHQHTDRGF